MMRDPEYYEDPTTFKPSRFANNNFQHRFLPFLAGPSMCIAHKFAMLEMKIILGSILQGLRLELTADADFRGCQGLTYHISPPLYLKGQSVRKAGESGRSVST